MRLHRLSVTAFGPFADTVEVDFDAVGRAGLFLIQGPTGAGKTSLLDAIAFALYAGVPGARPGGRALRSDHAGRDAVPSVTVDFSTGTRRMRVMRSPEFLRPKRRGEGETRTPAKVVLEEQVRGHWVVRSTRADEVGEVVTDLLGMGLEQFSKVVLLPQGEFAAFLRATADERRALLERLFDISTYTGVEGWLVEQRRERAAVVAQSQSLLGTDLARLEDVLAQVPSEVLGDAVDWPALPLEQLPSTLLAVASTLEAHAGAMLTALDAADLQAAATEAHRLHVDQVAERQRRGLEARAGLARLDASAAAHSSALARVEAATRAEVVSGDLRALARSTDRVDAMRRNLFSARAAVATAGLPEADPETIDGWLTVMTWHGAPLADAARAERGLAESQARAKELGRALDVARRRLDESRGRSTAQEEVLAAATLAQEGAEAARLRVERAVRVLDGVTRLHGLRTDLDRAGAESRDVADLLRSARDVEQDARADHQLLQQARLDAMAGELAGTLADGEPCVVCGSTTHPAPASVADVVAASDVAAAEAVWHGRLAQTLALLARIAALEQVVATRTADLVAAAREQHPVVVEPIRLDAEELCATVLALRLAAAREEVATARAEARRLVGAAADAETARREHERLTAELGELATGIAAAAATLQEVFDQATATAEERDSLLLEHEAACPCAIAGISRADAVSRAGGGYRVDAGSQVDDERGSPTGIDVGEPRDRHTRVASDVQRLRDLLRTEADLVEEHGVIASTTAEALRGNGFATVTAARTATLDPAEMRELRLGLKDADDSRASATATLSDDAVRAALECDPVDVEAAAAAARAARAQLREAQQEQTRAKTSARSFASIAGLVAERAALLGPLTRAADEVAQVADTVAGLGPHNTMRMRLTSFVLAARLEKVAALANERLQIMGDGRYELAHSDDLAAGGRRSGLGLVVRDQWTGQVRDTASLSGGESFMASLALALGLADAVREEAGGFDLQTLFIDEGFGTLDDESLEQVLSVLDGLRDGGRAVGVVSHVSDLRTRIPVQICVTKRATGSSVTVVGVDCSAA